MKRIIFKNLLKKWCKVTDLELLMRQVHSPKSLASLSRASNFEGSGSSQPKRAQPSPPRSLNELNAKYKHIHIMSRAHEPKWIIKEPKFFSSFIRVEPEPSYWKLGEPRAWRDWAQLISNTSLSIGSTCRRSLGLNYWFT